MPSGCTVWGNCSGCLLDGRNILCLLIWQVTLFVHTTVEITNMSITSQSSLMLLYNPSSRSSLHSTSPGNHKFASYNYRLFAFSRILYKWNQTECSFVWLFPLSKILFFFFLLYIYIYIYLIYLFIYGCVGSSSLSEGFLQLRRVGAPLHRGARASHRRGPSRCGAQAPDAQAQQLWPTGPAAPRHVGSSQTRARTRVPRIGRQILNHCATREAQQNTFEIHSYCMYEKFVPFYC